MAIISTKIENSKREYVYCKNSLIPHQLFSILYQKKNITSFSVCFNILNYREKKTLVTRVIFHFSYNSKCKRECCGETKKINFLENVSLASDILGVYNKYGISAPRKDFSSSYSFRCTALPGL